jgi:chaperonin GroES
VKYQPIADRLIVTEIREAKQTRGGLYIPDAYTSQKQIAFGTVIAAGAGRVNAEGKTVPLSVKVGDVIAFPRQAPAMIPVFGDDGEETIVLMLREAEVIAIVHGMPRTGSVVGLDGALMALQPQSIGLPDSVYENREGVDRAISDLRQSGAPPDVIADLQHEQRDQHEGEPDLVEH